MMQTTGYLKTTHRDHQASRLFFQRFRGRGGLLDQGGGDFAHDIGNAMDGGSNFFHGLSRLGDQPAAAGDLVPKTGSANNGDGARSPLSALESETSWPFGGNVDQ
jgi:hypothetical protein